MPVVVCVARKLRPGLSHSRRRDRIDLGRLRSSDKGGGGNTASPICVHNVSPPPPKAMHPSPSGHSPSGYILSRRLSQTPPPSSNTPWQAPPPFSLLHLRPPPPPWGGGSHPRCCAHPPVRCPTKPPGGPSHQATAVGQRAGRERGEGGAVQFDGDDLPNKSATSTRSSMRGPQGFTMAGVSGS